MRSTLVQPTAAPRSGDRAKRYVIHELTVKEALPEQPEQNERAVVVLGVDRVGRLARGPASVPAAREPCDPGPPNANGCQRVLDGCLMRALKSARSYTAAPVHLVNHLATMADLHRAGGYRMSDDVLTLTGQGPPSVQEFVRKNAATFTASAKAA